jgi:predicted DCC family thiol-disulfide oxidoreductase YuxK
VTGAVRLPVAGEVTPPPRPVVVYDDQCGFCRKWVGRLKRWDRHDRLALLPLRDASAPALTGRTRAELDRAVHVVLPSGAVCAGAAAFREICRYLPGGMIPRAALRLPGAPALAERLYRWIARRWGPVGDGAGTG